MPEIIPFNDCPHTESSWGDFNFRSYTNDTTQSFDSSGGWYPTNKNMGIFTSVPVYDSQNNFEGYNLDVVPNWDKLTWLSGTSDDWGFCGNWRPDNCESYLTDDTTKPNWAGYTSNTNSDLPFAKITTDTGCVDCDIGRNRILCSISEEMHQNSCPGYGKFINNPTVVNKGRVSGYYNDRPTESGYYADLDATLYPRGRGTCYYPKNIITNDTDLNTLLDLKNNEKIDPILADKLAGHYCYSTDTSGKTCGITADDVPIGTCTKYKVDEFSQDSINRPCTIWRNSLKQTTEGKTLLDTFARSWCEESDKNKYSPLCDCIKRDFRLESNPIRIRNFYDQMTKYVLTPSSSTSLMPIMDGCWYEPCKPNSYSMELYTPTTTCSGNFNICNNIINAKDGGKVYDVDQYTSCSIKSEIELPASDSLFADADTDTGTNTSLFLKPYFVIPATLFIVSIIVFALIKMSTIPAAVTSVATSTTIPAVASTVRAATIASTKAPVISRPK